MTRHPAHLLGLALDALEHIAEARDLDQAKHLARTAVAAIGDVDHETAALARGKAAFAAAVYAAQHAPVRDGGAQRPAGSWHPASEATQTAAPPSPSSVLTGGAR